MKLLLQRVGQKRASNSRIAIFIAAVACAFVFQRGALSQTTFKINTLTPNNVSAINTSDHICDDRGGIAVSTSNVFLEGDSDSSLSCAGSTGRASFWDRTSLSSPGEVGASRDGIVMDLHSQNVYTFADSMGDPVPTNGLNATTFTISKLVQLEPNTGGTTGTVISLSTPITITNGTCCNPGGQAGVFSGYDRIVVVNSTDNGGTVYNIDLPSGNVTVVGAITDANYSDRSSAENWATDGVAEFFGGNLYIDYVEGRASSPPHSKILRTNVSTNVTTTLVDFSPQDLSDMHEFTVVPTLGRWYFHFEACGSNSIANAGCDETLGFADATTTIANQCTPPPAGLTNWWPGDSNPDDIIGHRNGSLVGGVGYGTGEVGEAFNFDGSSGTVYLGSNNLLGGSTAVTIDAWVYPTSFAGYQGIIYPGPANIWWIQVLPGTGQIRFAINNGSFGSADTVGTIPLNTWSHIAMTWDGATAKLYINGIQDPHTLPTSGSIPDDSADSKNIGSRGGIDQFFSGLIDEVEIFNTALSATDIAKIYTAGSAGKCHACYPPPSGMVGWWPGDGNTKDIQNGNNGLLKNGATFGTGEVAQAFKFDGSDDYVLVKDDPSLQYSDFTYDAWVAPDADSPDGDHYIICKGVVNTYLPLIYITGFAGTHEWRVIVDGGVLAGGFVTYGYQHIAVTREGSVGKLYVDGVLRDTQSVGTTSSAGYDLNFGQIPGFYNGGAYFKGRLDEVELFNRALTRDEIQFIYDAGSVGKCKPTCLTPPPGLIDWWPGDNTAADIQGMHNGTLKNGTTFGNGKVERAFQFDGANDYVDLGFVDLPGTFSIDAWVNPVDGSNTSMIIANDDGANGYVFYIGTGGTLVASVRGPSTFYRASTSGSVITSAIWQHVAVTYNGGSFVFYVNGAVVPSVVINNIGGPPGTSTVSAKIGISGNGSDFPFNGRIDETELFNRVLDPSEVLDLYNAGSAGKCKTVRFYVSNVALNNPVKKYDADGNDVGTFADLADSITAPTGLAFDFSGNLYVASDGDNTLVRFDPLGSPTVFSDPSITSPLGVALNTTGVYVASYGSGRILKFDPGTQTFSIFASDSNNPIGLAFDTSGNLYAANYSNSTITKFDTGGVGTTFANSGLDKPYGLAFDVNGQLFAANANDNTIEKFDSAGNPTQFANSGLNYPIGLVFDLKAIFMPPTTPTRQSRSSIPPEIPPCSQIPECSPRGSSRLNCFRRRALASHSTSRPTRSTRQTAV